MKRRKLYTLLFTACLAGYVWLIVSYQTPSNEKFKLCLVKHITNLPCPACGSTRSVQALVSGDLLQSLLWNPFGLIISAIMLIAPFWIAYDVTTKKRTLFNAYVKFELQLQKRAIAIPLIILVLCNWGWNILKGF